MVSELVYVCMWRQSPAVTGNGSKNLFNINIYAYDPIGVYAIIPLFATGFLLN